MRSKTFSIILEDCLQRLDRGESLPELLADFPDLGDELQPLLLVAMASRALPIPNPSQRAQRLGRNQMLAEMNKIEIKKAFRKKTSIPVFNRWISGLVKAARSRGFTHLAYSYRLAMVSLVLVLSGGYFTISASASSQPGDLLYNLKLGLQRVGLTLIYTDSGSAGEDQLPITPEPWEFRQYVWALDNVYQGFEDPGSGTLDSEGLDNEKDKDLATAEKEAEKDLKEEDKEAAAADREAEQDLKEEDKDAAEAEKDTDKDLKEEEKDAAEDEKETEKDLIEEEKETAKAIRDAEKEDKKLDKIEKERVKDK